ncbi:MAG TPA: transglutaminase domain-containing protein [Anaerolineae bacterium]|nr:transglutaminase domain-containing protein [Anaerolineae bacterium]
MFDRARLHTARRPFAVLLSLILATMLALPPASAAPAPSSSATSVMPAPLALTSTQPDALAAPLTIAVQQSTFDAASAAAGGGITVTLTVRNNLPPLEAPVLNPSVNVTDTIAALTAFDYSRDPNRIRQVIVSDELLAGVSGFVSADPQPSRNGNRLVWNLGDLDPYGQATIQLRITAPGSAAVFTNLDSGAVVYGGHQGRMVSATAGPARLAPDGFAAFLSCTIDANCADPYIVEQAGRLAGDGVAAFGFVRDDIGYESYAGSLRGARGALWSAAGNAADQASLLIALLRARGVPARYLHGTLNSANAQTLVASMFPAASGVGGLAPADEPRADPVNSSALLDPARDHWWVEAYLPGLGWTQLDPSFAGAAVGQSFTTPQGPAVAELPDSVRHKVTIALKVEQYNVFSVGPGGVGLSAIQPLSQTFNTVELVGEPVTLGHLVSTDSSGGMVYSNYEHTYVPYLIVGLEETLYPGDPYLELLTNFPLASNPILAQWLMFTVTAPDGSSETFERELFDYVGFDARQGSGAINTDVQRTSEPVLRETTQFTTLFAPSGVSLDALNHTYPAMVQAVFDGQDALEATDAIVAAGDFSAADWAVLSDARVTFGRVTRLAQRMSLLKFAAVSDFTAAAYGEAFQVKAYADSPRIISVAWEEDVETGTGTLSMDLRRNELNVVPYPGQTLDGLRAFNTARGLFEMSLESQILDEIGIEPVTSVAAILAAADAQNIPLGMYTVTQLDQLAALPISSIAKARITADLTANPRHVVAVPTENVLLDGEPAIGWLQIDMATGEIIDVQENGQHMVAVEYATLLNSSIQEIGFAMAGFAHGFAAYTFAWLGGFFAQVPIEPGSLAAAKAAAASTASALTSSLESAIGEMCCGTDEWTEAYLGGVTLLNISLNFGDIYSYELVDIKIGGFSNGVAAAESIIGASDPPLPKLLYSRYAPHFGDEVARAVRSAGATLPAGVISANLSTASASLLGGLDADWSAPGRHALDFASLTAANGTVSEPGGPVLGSGAISASAILSRATALSNSSTPLIVAAAGDGGVGLYAPAASGLAGGAQWQDYAGQLSSFAPYSLRLDGAAVTVAGNTYSGTLDLALSVPAAVAGAGRGPAPNFASSAQVALTTGGVMVNPASGSLTVGGTATSPANGFALANFSGSATASQLNANSDTVTLSGTGDYFALSLSPASSSIPATGSASFASNIAANASGSYTMTVFAPPGWTASVDGSGQVTAAPPPGAAPGVYQVLVTAQSVAHPDLFASAIHQVTTTAVQAVEVSVTSDSRWSVPWGIELRDDGLGATNTGQVQLPGAAFTIDVNNPSTVAHSFDVTVSGLPAGWSILDGQPGSDATTIQVPAGGSGQIGLYVRPTGSLTPIGATYPFVATATDNDGAGLSDSGNGVFTMPSIPFNFLTAEPDALYTAANSSVDFDVLLQNVGNAAASFPLSAQMPAGDWSLSGLASPVNLNAGQTSRQGVTLNVGAGSLGQTFEVLLASPATGTIYTQRLRVPVRIVGPGVGAGFGGAAAAEVCDANGATASAMQTLAIALANLEGSCATGTCDLRLRDAAVDAANSAADYAALYYPLADSAGDLTTLAAALAGHTTPAQINADIADLGDALAALGGQVCEISQHLPSLRWRPNFDAGLPGQPVDYTLELSNRGTVDTSYAVTLTLPGGVSTLNPTVAAGATYTETVAASSPTLGQFALLAEAEATGAGVEMPGVRASATGWLNVVERFVQLTAAVVDPPFVETGVSSTTLSIDVVNVANVAREATARAELRAEGGALAWSADIPLTLAAGAPQRYQLATVDTSGWNAGLYTATVELLDADEALIPDGSGYAFLAVGQALGLSHAIAPAVAAPGNVTATTVITSEILVDTILPDSVAEAKPLWEPQGLRAAGAWELNRETGAEVVSAADQSGVSITLTPAPSQRESVLEEPAPAPDESSPELPSDPLAAAAQEEVIDEIIPDNGRAPDAAVTRAEQTDAGFTYGGSWVAVTNNRASGNSFARSRTAGHTVSYGFTGDWVTLGLFGASNAGQAELFIDAVSQGVIDLYRREDTAYGLFLDGLGGGAHTISLTVLGTHDPKSTDNWVGIDYVDTWDGAALPDGLFEQTDPRVLLSGGWSNVNDANASGGSYYRGSNSNAWFAFSGDSFTYRAMTRSAARSVRLFVDGEHLTDLDLFAWGNTPRVFSFQGFGAGLHVVQVSNLNGEGTVDAFNQPGSAPWTDPNPPAASFQRYEEDHADWLYNSEPFTVTARTWTRENVGVTPLSASQGQFIWSGTAADSAALAIDGSWAAVGFTGDSQGGSAEIFLDGVSQGVIDTYRNEVEPVSFPLGAFSPGSHTVSVVAQGDGRVRLDYLDVWDGTALPDGVFAANGLERFYLDKNWDLRTSISPAGQYLRSGAGNAWFPFSGDSVSFSGWADGTVREVRLFVDDSYQGTFDLEASGAVTPTWSFDGFGAGIHVLRVQGWKSNASIGAFVQPGSAPFYTPPAIGAFQRYEEDWPAILYNGQPFTSTVTSWTRLNNSSAAGASSGQVIWSGAAGDTASFAFSGVEVGVGFTADRFGGRAEVFIDGVSRGVIDTYHPDNDFVSAYYDGLAGGPHTLTVSVLGTSHVNASGTRVYLDFIDVWSGAALPDGTFEQDDSRVQRSGDWSNQADANASGGSYGREGLINQASVWFPFSGDSVTYQAMARSDGDQFAIARIDGQFAGYLNLYSSSIVTRTFSFGGLGAGLHVLHIQRHRGELTVDAFRSPGSAPFFSPPSYSGIVRYEENDPAMRYNGFPYSQRPQSWSETGVNHASGSTVVGSATANNTASLQFSGTWINVGFRTRNTGGQAEVLIDGVSQGIIGLYSAADEVTAVQFGGLAAGAHTVVVRVVGAPDPPSSQNNVWLDYIDVYDGTVVSDSFSNANLAQHNGRVHFSSYLGTFPAANGIEGDYSGITAAANVNVWYSFVGDSFTFYAFSRNNNPQIEVIIDETITDTVSVDYDFTDSPVAFHYTGLSDGPHSVRVNNISNMRVDGFAANPTSLTPYLPMVEWYDDTPAGNGAPFFGSLGMVSGMAAGDINNDGVVELVFGSDTLLIWGKLFVYRADGGDTGDGDPILWTKDIGGAPPNRALIGSIALANLDGAPNSEIVVHSSKDLRVYYADGTQWWINTALKGFDILGAPAIGNVDGDPEPEIVTNADKTLAVLDGDGTVLWTTTFADYAVAPLLADMTGDGRLDIIAADYGDGSAGRPTNVRLYDFNFGAPVLEWSVPITPAIRTGGLNGLLGSHAVGDIDGQQPGGDPGPEIAISHNGNLTVLDEDGSTVWSTALEPGNPGGVSIADIDGDGEVEIVTGMKHEYSPGHTGKLYALNADGTLLWEVIAEDGTSANSASVLDLNGDGIYEVAWTGREQGFTIFDGATGDVIFYEPLVYSITGSDHPIIIDADNDGQAEIVAASLKGPRVFGMGGAWTNSRPLWNQQTYHITNVNDDLSVPAAEVNSWEVHNTYRTQTAEPQPLPVFGVTLTHTVGISNVTVLTGTFNVAPSLAADPVYGWGYQQDATEDVITRTFDSLLTALQPGEARQAAQGTAVQYKLGSGQNTLTLPPLYVAAPHIIAVDPAERAAGSGTTVSYPVILTNPGVTASVYDLSVAGLPAGWWSLPASVAVPAQSSVTPQLLVTIPPGEEAGTWDFVVLVETSQGGQDQAGGRLEGLGPLLEIAVSPAEQSGLTGDVLTYTLTITNLETTARSYDLSASGLAEVGVQSSFGVPASSSASLEFTARPAMPGPNPFSVTAEVAATGAAATADALATGVGFTSVGVSLEPGTAPAGPASSAVLTATISNLGTLADTYELTVDAPAGWTAALSANGAPVSQVTLAAGAFSSASFHLVVTPPIGATPGAYPVTVNAVSQADQPGAPAQAEDSATVQVGTRGVQVEFISGPSSLLPSQAGAWQVRVTNRGSVADSYSLSALGVFSGAAQFTPATVSLGAGASQVVQLNAGPLPFALPGATLLTASAQSNGDSAIAGEDTTAVTFGGQEAVEVGWQPVSQTISQTLEATYMLLITNTGNIETTYVFDVTAPDLQVVSQQLAQLSIPPHMTAANLVTLRASQAGVFPFDGQASSDSSPATDSAGAELIVVCPGDADVDNDGDVTVLDITAVAERWDAFDLGNYSFVHDLNCDGVIDIVDIQTAAGAFGSP